IRPGTDHAAAAALFLGAIQGLVIQSMVSGSVDGMRAQAEAVFGLYVQGLEAQP
ncbi:MAG: TetR/AcrR family transcriptional regulator, partial [Proteobacteria bacterium]|nr:TetR/AcrR family transcriptional regulator [Pseudomonadota bacterium]